MHNLYFGKSNNRFLLYLDPINIDLLELTKKSNYVVCNELQFDGDEEISVRNSILTSASLINLLQKNKSLTEFNLIIDNKLHIENIWWDDVLIISNFESMIYFIYELRAKLNAKNQKLLDLMLSKPGTYFTVNQNNIIETSIEAITFISFIKDSERYIEKEYKFI
ncbi:hypothetical protein [Flavobacterium sp.]|uniref:hypothetical protein n=1 Tax=Flavobacterium sp. TaxID=239 RepID=UPI003BDA19D9